MPWWFYLLTTLGSIIAFAILVFVCWVLWRFFCDIHKGSIALIEINETLKTRNKKSKKEK